MADCDIYVEAWGIGAPCVDVHDAVFKVREVREGLARTTISSFTVWSNNAEKRRDVNFTCGLELGVTEGCQQG